MKSSTSGPVERRRAPAVGIIFLRATGFGGREILTLRRVFRFCFLATLREVRCGLPGVLVAPTVVFRGSCSTLLTFRLTFWGAAVFRFFIEIRLLLGAIFLIFLNC